MIKMYKEQKKCPSIYNVGDNLQYDWRARMHEKLYVWKFLQIKFRLLFHVLLVTRRAEFRAHI